MFLSAQTRPALQSSQVLAARTAPCFVAHTPCSFSELVAALSGVPLRTDQDRCRPARGTRCGHSSRPCTPFRAAPPSTAPCVAAVSRGEPLQALLPRALLAPVCRALRWARRLHCGSRARRRSKRFAAGWTQSVEVPKACANSAQELSTLTKHTLPYFHPWTRTSEASRWTGRSGLVF